MWKYELDKTKPLKHVLWDRKFLTENNLIASLTTTSEEIVECLTGLEKRIAANNISFDELKEECFQIVCRVPIITVEIDVPLLVRCRIHDFGDRKFNVSELSYNPKIEFAHPGRFNTEREPMFYAVSPSENIEDFPPELAAIFETKKELRNKDFSITEDIILAISYWKVVKPFWSLIFPSNTDAETKNLTFKKSALFFRETLLKKFDRQSQSTIKFVNQFLSEKAGCIKEDDTDYLLTAGFKHGLEKYYQKTVQAVFYPSVMSDNYCINVAVNKNAVDEGFIKFDHAVMGKINKQKQIVPISGNAYANEEGYLQFAYL